MMNVFKITATLQKKCFKYICIYFCILVFNFKMDVLFLQIITLIRGTTAMF